MTNPKTPDRENLLAAVDMMTELFDGDPSKMGAILSDRIGAHGPEVVDFVTAILTVTINAYHIIPANHRTRLLTSIRELAQQLPANGATPC